ncbi:hypothetical protein [Geodermatophilus sp. DSM 44513]|uniref:hypothetical protein n=1 Tax=Geodermatophilus sp. DSM 44513 TaxID=1528104 RepID=UPI0028F700F3|nr:hypothetical protein [Geodermatophilus sp. DSM 44513]WNV76853.1 hypothetical protein RTG05_06145 [Geodermatophilus sp. DSM 44513]
MPHAAPAVAGRPVPPAPGSASAALRSPVRTLRWLWPAYVTPGRPGRPTTQQELRWLYGAWLGAFALKVLGSSWDVSWHFRWLRDDLAPPHLLNSAGTVVVVALVLFSGHTGHGVDRRALRLVQAGTAVFLVAVPVDLVNHRVNGLDITSWSPSHALLYLGTAVMLAGVLRGWWLYAAPGRVRDAVALGLWLLFVENVLFPNQHQEYGVLSLRAYEAGVTTAEPQLLDFAVAQGQSPTSFMLPVPAWVHPAWLLCAGLLSLVVARRVTGLRWAATALAALYLAYRAVVWLGLEAAGFPPSVLPVALLAGAVAVDVAVTRGLPGWLAGPLVTAATYLAGALLAAAGVLPPWDWRPAAVLLTGTAFTLLWVAVETVARSRWLATWRTPLQEPAVGGAPTRPDVRDRPVT